MEKVLNFQVRVGDILCVEDGDEFPCDMVLLATSNKNGRASVMTANLDGETNLKHRYFFTVVFQIRRVNLVMNSTKDCN